MAGMHSLDFRELTPGPGGWLKAAGKLGRHRRVPGAEGPRGRAALGLFDRLRSALVGGRWESVHDVLSSRLRRAASAGALAEHLRANGAALRKAYRDAVVTRVVPEEEEAVLIVDWGRQGFAFRELKVICEAGEQRFDSVPWGRQLVGRPRGERLERAAHCAAEHERNRRGRRHRLIPTFVVVLCMTALPTAFGLHLYGRFPSPYVIVPLLIFGLLCLLFALLWEDPHRWLRGPRSPDARPRR